MNYICFESRRKTDFEIKLINWKIISYLREIISMTEVGIAILAKIMIYIFIVNL